jgi:hypothetical protein
MNMPNVVKRVTTSTTEYFAQDDELSLDEDLDGEDVDGEDEGDKDEEEPAAPSQRRRKK